MWCARWARAGRRVRCAVGGRGYGALAFGEDGYRTADLCDRFHPTTVDVTTDAGKGEDGGRDVQVVSPALGLRHYGVTESFHGEIVTVKCFENNPLVREAVMEEGRGRVLVVDGGGSLRCALLGDMLAGLAEKNYWAGIVVNGCIRDSLAITEKGRIGIKALGTHPLKSSKRDRGLRDVPVMFGGVTFTPGHYLYADRDGIVVSDRSLGPPPS